MPEFHLACQTITFGPDQRDHFDDVFSAVHQAGYPAVEIGLRHWVDLPRRRFQEMLLGHGLKLAASHIGGNLEDADQAEGERRVLDVALDALNALHVKFLMYSGLRFESDEQLARDIAMLNRAAEQCEHRGVRLCYHNHNWEFADGARIMNALIAEGSEQLGFCPDVGWVHKGGADVIPFLERIRARMPVMHFKDFATRGEGVDTVVLGTGCVPLREVADWMKANLSQCWVITEQDKSGVPAAEAVRRNADFCREVLPVLS